MATAYAPFMPMTARAAEAALRQYAHPDSAEVLPKFFRCGPGEYGEGDKFLGVSVPNIRLVVKDARDLAWNDIQKLLRSPWHEVRMLGLLTMVAQARRSQRDAAAVVMWGERYLSVRAAVNNWDLVDCSAEHLVGPWLLGETPPRDADATLTRLAESVVLWDRRIAMVSHLYCVRSMRSQIRTAGVFAMAERLLHDSEDLMHKAVGWLLREAGKRDVQGLRDFLRRHHASMPRTTLRYAIEKFSDNERKKWLSLKSSGSSRR